jgi:hypothetical protein
VSEKLSIVCIHSRNILQEVVSKPSHKRWIIQTEVPKALTMYNPSRRLPKYIDLTPVSSYIWFALQLMRGVQGFQCAKIIPHILKTPSAATDTPSLSSFHIRLSFQHLRAPTPVLLLLCIAPRPFHCSRQNSEEEEERGH